MKQSKSSLFLKVGLALVIVLGAARLYAPVYIKDTLNGILADLPGYRGYIADVDISLWRGAYQIQDFEFKVTSGENEYPFLHIDEVDLSIQWGALLRGKLVSEVEIYRPAVQLYSQLFKVMGKEGENRPEDEPKETKKSVEDSLAALYPFSLNRFAIVEGTLIYTLQSGDDKVEIPFRDVSLEVRDISNQSSEELPSPLALKASVLNSGSMSINGLTNFLKAIPQFDLNGSVEGLKLTDINPILKLYSDIDFESGRANLFSELKSDGDTVSGYLKPVVHDIDLFKMSEDNDSIGELLTEGVLGGFASLFENQEKDRLATEIPLTGELSDPKVQGLKAFMALLRNAFIKALPNRLIEKWGVANYKVKEIQDAENQLEAGR